MQIPTAASTRCSSCAAGWAPPRPGWRTSAEHRLGMCRPLVRAAMRSRSGGGRWARRGQHSLMIVRVVQPGRRRRCPLSATCRRAALGPGRQAGSAGGGHPRPVLGVGVPIRMDVRTCDTRAVARGLVGGAAAPALRGVRMARQRRDVAAAHDPGGWPARNFGSWCLVRQNAIPPFFWNNGTRRIRTIPRAARSSTGFSPLLPDRIPAYRSDLGPTMLT